MSSPVIYVEGDLEGQFLCIMKRQELNEGGDGTAAGYVYKLHIAIDVGT